MGVVNKLKELLGPRLIGTGTAEKAAKDLSGREKQLRDQEDEVMGVKPKKR